MRIERGVMVFLGYGKYFRSDRIVGLEPLEEGRGSGRWKKVYVEDVPEPIIASRSESAILRELTETPKEITRIQEQYQLLTDIADTVAEINPVVRAIIRDQGKWDLGRLEERIKEILRDEERVEGA
jgi:hypothetical protein